MPHFIILLSLLFLNSLSQPNPKVISVSAEGSVELAADIIRFDVNLNAEADTPESAFRLHKKREEALVQLLDKYKIKETDIDFQPVSISKSRRFNRPNEEIVTYQTGQMVQLTLEDFDIYDKIQVALINHGFDNFSGYFQSSKEESGRDEALKNAIRTAKNKARLIADEAGVELGSISNISYSTRQHQPMERQASSFMKAEDSGGLMKYNQTIVLRATIQIDFEITGPED